MTVNFYNLTLLTLATLAITSANASANNQDACKRISEGAVITGTKVLVIGVEGLWSFSSSGTKKAYEHRCRVTRGLASNTPSSGFGGFVLKDLIVPLIDEYKNKVEVVVVPHGDAGSTTGKAFHCAKAWMSEKRPGTEGRKVYLVGHSFGGYALTKLTKNLGNTPIAGVLSIDARLSDGPLKPKMKRQGNVDRWENYYQVFPLRGYTIENADVNQRLDGARHVKMPGHPTVKSALRSMIGSPPGPEVVAGSVDDCKALPKSGRTGIFSHQGTERDPGMRTPSGISGIVTDGEVDDKKIPPQKGKESGIGKAPVPTKSPGSSEVPLAEANPSPGKCPKNYECRWDYNIFTGEKVYLQKPVRDFGGSSKLGSVDRASGGEPPVGDERSPASINLGGGNSDSGNTRMKMETISEVAQGEAASSPQVEIESTDISGVSPDGSANQWANSGSSRSNIASRSNTNSGGVVVDAILQSKANGKADNENLFQRVKKKIQEQMSSRP